MEMSRYKELTAALELAKEHRDGPQEYMEAAVVVPLVEKNGELGILFEVRASTLAWQPGEICFPGGRIENSDSSPLAAALRETVEELGLSSAEIAVLGDLPEVTSSIGVRVHPFVAEIAAGAAFNINSGEVAEYFIVPLDFLLKSEPRIGTMQRCTRPLDDFPFELLPDYPKTWKSRKHYQVFFYTYQNYVIWGLTAQVLHSFLRIYRQSLIRE